MRWGGRALEGRAAVLEPDVGVELVDAPRDGVELDQDTIRAL